MPVEQLSGLEIGIPAPVRIVLEVRLEVHVTAQEADRIVEAPGFGDLPLGAGRDDGESEACHQEGKAGRQTIHVAPLRMVVRIAAWPAASGHPWNTRRPEDAGNGPGHSTVQWITGR